MLCLKQIKQCPCQHVCAAKPWAAFTRFQESWQRRAGDKAGWPKPSSSPAGLMLGTGECEAVPSGAWGLEGRAATGPSHAGHGGVLSSAVQWLWMALPGACTSHTRLQDAPEKWINIYHSFLEIYNPHSHIKCSEKSCNKESCSNGWKQDVLNLLSMEPFSSYNPISYLEQRPP